MITLGKQQRGTRQSAYWYPRGIDGDRCVPASTVLAPLRKSKAGQLGCFKEEGKRTATMGIFRGKSPATLFLIVTLDQRKECRVAPMGHLLLNDLEHDNGPPMMNEPCQLLLAGEC